MLAARRPGVAASANKSCDARGAVARRERGRWRREGVRGSHVRAMEGPRRGQFLPDNLRSFCCCFGALRDLCRLRRPRNVTIFGHSFQPQRPNPSIANVSLDTGNTGIRPCGHAGKRKNHVSEVRLGVQTTLGTG